MAARKPRLLAASAYSRQEAYRMKTRCLTFLIALGLLPLAGDLGTAGKLRRFASQSAFVSL